MYIFKNAIKNLVRNKGRNILMGLIILAIIATTAVSLIISNTASGIIDNYKNRFGVQVTISPDVQKLMSQGQGGIKSAQIDPEMYLSFGDSNYLKSAQFSFTVSAVSDAVHPVGAQDAESQGGNVLKMQSSSANPDSVRPNMKIIGNSSLDNLTEFTGGQRAIVDGAMYSADNECVISKDLADLNNLKVGDVITIKNATAPSQGIYDLKITGIYQDATDEYGNMPVKDPYMNRRNEILTTLETVMGPTYTETSGISPSANFILKNPADLAGFEAEVRAKGLPDVFDVSTDEAGYNKIVGPIVGLKGLTMTFMIIVLVLGGIVLVLLSSIAIRERKYEVGVLRAMGMKKGKVALGLLTEMLIVTGLCVILGLGVGVATAQPISNSLLQTQVKAAEASQAQSGKGLFLVVGGKNLTAGTDAKAISEMDVGLDGKTVMQIIAISLIMAAASAAVSISRIAKYEPIRILMERN